MAQINLSALQQGIQRMRDKGSADPRSLYDLVNGYVALDGSIRSRPGTSQVETLPAGTHGLVSHKDELVVFAIAPKTMPAGFRCEVTVSPDDPTTDIERVWFARAFLGYIYAVIEFTDGKVYHYFLQDADAWEANKVYAEGATVSPTTPNGLVYKAKTMDVPRDAWAAGLSRNVSDEIVPTTANGFYYECVSTGGTNPRSGQVEPTWPTTEDATVKEFADNEATNPPPPGGSTGGGTPPGNRGCVVVTMFMDDGTIADDARSGDRHVCHSPGEGFAVRPIEVAAKSRQQACVRIETDCGAALECSRSTPFTHYGADSDDQYSLAPDMMGRKVRVRIRGKNKVATVVKVVDIGMRSIKPLDFGGRSFAAGVDKDKLVFSHNMAKKTDPEDF